MSVVRTPALTPEKAFLHLIYDYRYIALAAFAWRKYGVSGAPSDLDEINHLIPGVGVIIQDSLLLHARALVDFYTKGASDDTDILLEDFGFAPIASGRKARLKQYKPSVELNLMHLTAYRDKDFRRHNPTTLRGTPSKRINWNKADSKLIDEFVDVLRVTPKRRGAWSRPFQDLYKAVESEIGAPGNWPKHLSEKSAVNVYLRKQGFTV